MNILLIAGSPTVPSRSTRLLHHVGDKLALLGHRIDKLQVRDLPAQALMHGDFANLDLNVARSRVEHADAVVIATPVYKASYSGLLKAFLDILPQTALAGKLILPLATGGSQSHMLALDYALRPVLSSLAARHILPSIYATDAQVVWAIEQGLTLDADIAKRVAEGVTHLAGSLARMHSVVTPDFAPVHFSQVQYSG
ncbi:FMN reductase [Actimicrobium sp. GrIS 1.19]|uniref:NADPH-dependent FMN reductase n=1 Tax=Actimicrobium sp. GrIS 1.19 TaxID=3071708 RepID=UPI002E0B3CF2|nr:FMN reductase [Actimicrobium sp. GrIS 1.19]